VTEGLPSGTILMLRFYKKYDNFCYQI